MSRSHGHPSLHGAATRPLWWDTAPPAPQRPELRGRRTADVAIVGGGLTALWTADSLLRAAPSTRIAIVEAEHVGFGASSRNGGWCSALLPMSHDAVAAAHGAPAAEAMRAAMHRTVAEVVERSATLGIDADIAYGGTVTVARNEAQRDRLRAEHRAALDAGQTDLAWLDRDAARARLGATNVLGGTYTPHCAAIHPTKLVRGLADSVEHRGAVLFERSRVTAIGDGRLTTARGTVDAALVVRATEAFTARLPGLRRTIAPIYSLMVATEPLPPSAWESIGLGGRETFADARVGIVYGQRTADDRLAFGGRGAPYHYASSMRPGHEIDDRIHARLADTLVEMFPVLRGVRITHRWGGAVGAPRDWWCSVGIDRTAKLAWAGGYVGDGVATTNLAGRTLADLILGRTNALTELGWVGHRSPRWEPEPLRWLGINAALRLPDGIDRAEARPGGQARWRTALLRRLTSG